MHQDPLKSKVFDSAWNIVEKEGMDQLTIRKIAERSDCSLAAIYSVFENFRELQLRINANILSNLYQIFNETTERSLKENASLKELFRNLGVEYIKFGEKNRFLWKALFEYDPVSAFPDWYTKHTHHGIHDLSKKLSQIYQVNEEKMRVALGFFWASIHGICSILLNRKLEMVAEFFNAEVHFTPYIEYCLQGLFAQEEGSLKPRLLRSKS